MWSTGSFVRADHNGDKYIGRVLRITWDREKHVSASVEFVGQCVSNGITGIGNEVHVVTFEEAKLMKCTEAEVEWLKAFFAHPRKKIVYDKPRYTKDSSDRWWVTETTRITQASEIAKAIEVVAEEGGSFRRGNRTYRDHTDEEGERFYTKEVTRPLDPEEVEQLELQEGVGDRRVKWTQHTFDDFVPEDKIRRGGR